jgi:hypothetical protein
LFHKIDSRLASIRIVEAVTSLAFAGRYGKTFLLSLSSSKLFFSHVIEPRVNAMDTDEPTSVAIEARDRFYGTLFGPNTLAVRFLPLNFGKFFNLYVVLDTFFYKNNRQMCEHILGFVAQKDRVSRYI